jgi:gamma-glutamylcyclotransferase (GGCT)/AIG2-like uncharacterized protein YtfP
VLAWLPDGADETAIVEAAAADGIGITGVGTRRVEPGRPGLIFGYGAIAAGPIEEGVARLAAIVARTRAPVHAPGPWDLPVAVYGTLRRGEHNAGFLAGARFLGTGRVDGRLHDMPTTDARRYGYPCLVDWADPTASAGVAVELYALDQAALAATDRLEAYDPADEAGSEYVRRAVDVHDGPADRAWVYVYNGPLEAIGPEIPDGDWVAHRRRSSTRPRRGAVG